MSGATTGTMGLPGRRLGFAGVGSTRRFFDLEWGNGCAEGEGGRWRIESLKRGGGTGERTGPPVVGLAIGGGGWPEERGPADLGLGARVGAVVPRH